MSLRAKRSNLDVASDKKRDCRALWARNDDDNFKTLKRHKKNKYIAIMETVFVRGAKSYGSEERPT